MGLIAFVCALTVPAMAQNTPIVEVFGGYSYARVDLTDIKHVNANGWSASATENLNSWFGGTLEVSGYYAAPRLTIFGITTKPGSNVYTVLFGPRFSYRKFQKLTPFVHALLGVAHIHASENGFSTSDNSFAAALGGGVDVRLGDKFAVRVVQGDYVYTRFMSLGISPQTGGIVFSGPRVRQNNFRVSAGVVLCFGKK